MSTTTLSQAQREQIARAFWDQATVVTEGLSEAKRLTTAGQSIPHMLVRDLHMASRVADLVTLAAQIERGDVQVIEMDTEVVVSTVITLGDSEGRPVGIVSVTDDLFDSECGLIDGHDYNGLDHLEHIEDVVADIKAASAAADSLRTITPSEIVSGALALNGHPAPAVA